MNPGKSDKSKNSTRLPPASRWGDEWMMLGRWWIGGGIECQFSTGKLKQVASECTYMETSNPLLKRESTFSRGWEGTESMTLQGVINKTGTLLLLCLSSAAFAWTQ